MTDSHHPPRWRIALVREAEGPSFTTDILRTSTDVAHAFAFLATHDREEFWLAALDQRHRIIGTHQVSVGTLTASLVSPRLCFAKHKRGYVAAPFMCSSADYRLIFLGDVFPDAT